MSVLLQSWRKNRTTWLTFIILLLLFLLAIQGMDVEDWAITILRGLAVGSVTFLVASGFSLIFGLLDVLNLAHGTLFMIGAYLGWTVYVRPDTFVDLLTPALFLGGALALMPVWRRLLAGLRITPAVRRAWPWVVLVAGAATSVFFLSRYPLTVWDLDRYEVSPVAFSFQAGQGDLVIPEPNSFTGLSPVLGLGGLIFGLLLVTVSLAGFEQRRQGANSSTQAAAPLPRKALLTGPGLIAAGLLVFASGGVLTNVLLAIGSNWRFLVAVIVAVLTGGLLGGLMEFSLIRPLYSRPIYQLMLTLGLSAIGIEVVRAIWGRPEFTMPKPAIFNGSGEGCPALSFTGWLEHGCSTVMFLGARVRTYNEIFIPLVGLLVLVSVWLLLKRTRLGMIIRAGVQDSEMVEALGINVRRIFTLVFALGVGLAALGGVLAAPSIGLSNLMGESFLLNALIALAVGGLTSYPGAAAGSVIVGLLQQFIIKYGQIGIPLPFTDIIFKPSPPLVPASTVLLMVIILLILPNGLLGKKE